MPMIDVFAATGTFRDPHKLAADLARTLMTIEGVPDIPMFRQNTAGFVHEMVGPAISNVDGDSGYVRVQVLTNAGARPRQAARGGQPVHRTGSDGSWRPLALRSDLGPSHRGRGGWLGLEWPRQHQRGFGSCSQSADCRAVGPEIRRWLTSLIRSSAR
jgi:hypothetical protein